MKDLLLWKGKQVQEYTKEELIEIMYELHEMIQEANRRLERYMRMAV